MCICNGHDDTVSDANLLTLQQLLELWVWWMVDVE